MTGRVTAFAIQSNGSRSYGLVVRGVKVLITADESQYVVAEKLAAEVAELGPEYVAEPERETAPERNPEPAVSTRKAFTEGQVVWCRVHGSQGLCKVTEIGSGRNRGRIKIAGVRGWCPDSNFLAEEPR